MTFNKPPDWGRRFAFPENVQVEYNGAAGSLTSEIVIKMEDRYEDAVVEQIAMEAKMAGVADCTVLNKAAILNALDKQTPKKPIFVDTRFRNHGRSVADGVSLAKCYKCPTCWSHIFHVWDSEKHCVHCGQALDWGTDNA